MKSKIVLIWSEGFPYKYSASNEKNSLIAKMLSNADIDVELTSKLPFKRDDLYEGSFENIKYKNFYNKESANKKIGYLKAIYNEIKYIVGLKKEYNQVALIGSYTFFLLYIIYGIICRIYSIKLVLNLMEWHIAVVNNKPFYQKANPILFDYLATRLSSRTLVISRFIEGKTNKIVSSSSIYFLPALSDYNLIKSIPKKNKQSYILYCGGIGYFEVIKLVIDSFSIISEKISQNLVLIVHGLNSDILDLKRLINRLGIQQRVEIISNLEYEDLISYYKGADILLAPLRNSEQDIARYPQKIAEYAACGIPVISNQVGQIAFDFEHSKDIYFSKAYSKEALSEAIVELINSPEQMKYISEKIESKAKDYFDYNNYSESVSRFIFKTDT